MAAKRMELIGLTVLALAATATVALAQSFTLPEGRELAVSPALPSGLLSGESSGSNPLTGLPCSGGGASAVSVVGGLSDTATLPPGDDSADIQAPPIVSVFGSGSTLGAC
jgi:hypothetical protein